MKIHQVLVSRPVYEDPWVWTVPALNLNGTTPRLDDIKDEVRKVIAASSTKHEEAFEVELFVRFDPDAAREVHHGAIRMCTLLGFYASDRSNAGTLPPRIRLAG